MIITVKRAIFSHTSEEKDFYEETQQYVNFYLYLYLTEYTNILIYQYTFPDITVDKNLCSIFGGVI